MKEEEGQQDVAGIPARGILIGALLALLLNGLDAYATTIIRGSYLTLNFSTPAALFFFFFLVPASGLVYCLRRSLALTQSELITIYIMLVVACCIPGMGFTQFIIPCLVGSTYYATPENNWDFLYNQYIPTWMIPRGENVARYFLKGCPRSCHSLGSVGAAADLLVRFLLGAQRSDDLHDGHTAQAMGRSGEAGVSVGAGADGDDKARGGAGYWAGVFYQ